MANYVTVSCVANVATRLSLMPGTTNNESVRRHWAAQIAQVLPDRPDLILLPEYADVPRYVTSDAAEHRAYLRDNAGSMLDMLSAIAADNGCYIAYPTVATQPGGGLANSMVLIDRHGVPTGRYDKRQPTIGEHDEYGIRYGGTDQTFQLDFGRVGCVICFDLNFGEVMTGCANPDVRLVLFASMFHGSFLQNYWAYSCGAYFAAAIHPPEPSQIISPVGETLARATSAAYSVTHRLNLDYAVLHWDDNNERFAAIKRKYGRSVAIHDPGLLGSLLLTSEDDTVTAAMIVDEFDLETLSGYMARSRRHRMEHTHADGCGHASPSTSAPNERTVVE